MITIERPGGELQVAVAPDHVAAVLGGKQLGKAIVLGRRGKLVADVATPRCPR